MGVIQYHLAKDEHGESIDIKDVNEENRRSKRYFCRCCGGEMTPVLGQIREKHFRHLVETNCDGESYLHQIAKEQLKKRFESELPFVVKYDRKTTCDKSKKCPLGEKRIGECSRETEYPFDLKKHYNQCILEPWDPKTGKKPDLLLKSDDPQYKDLYLEVFVTHPCSEDKIKKKVPIIEFKISSEEEALGLLNTDLKGKIYKSDDYYNEYDYCRIWLYNFKEESNEHVTLKNYQDSKVRAAILQNGYIKTTIHDCSDECLPPRGDEVATIEFIPNRVSKDGLYLAKKLFAKMQIGNFRSCYWCSLYRETYNGDKICILYKQGKPKYPDQRYAYGCDSYSFKNIDITTELKLKEGMTLEQLQEKMKNVPKSPAAPTTQTKELISDSLLSYMTIGPLPPDYEITYAKKMATDIYNEMKRLNSFSTWRITNPQACHYKKNPCLIFNSEMKQGIFAILRNASSVFVEYSLYAQYDRREVESVIDSCYLDTFEKELTNFFCRV